MTKKKGKNSTKSSNGSKSKQSIQTNSITAVSKQVSKPLHEEKATNERQRVEKYWRSLSQENRKKIVRVEKYELLKKIKEKHRHICSCTVCGRKRAVIDREVEKLYDQYCEELEFRNSIIPSSTGCSHHHHHIHHIHQHNFASLPHKNDQLSTEFKNLQQKHKIQQLNGTLSQEKRLEEEQLETAADLLAKQQKQIQQLQLKQKELQLKQRQHQKEQQLLQQQKQQLQELQLLQKKKCIAMGNSQNVNNLTKSANAGNSSSSTVISTTEPHQNQEEFKSEFNGNYTPRDDDIPSSSVLCEEEDDSQGESSSDEVSDASSDTSISDCCSDLISTDEQMCWEFGQNLIVNSSAITITDAWLFEHGQNVIDLFHRFEKCDSGSSDRLEMMMLGSANRHRGSMRKPISARTIRTQKITTTTTGSAANELPNGTMTTSKNTTRNGVCTETTTTKYNNGTTTITTTTTFEENINEEEEDEEDYDEEEDVSEEEDDEEDDDEEEDEEDDDEEDEDTEQSKWRESKKMFRMYAAKLFYEKIVMAFKEKVAYEMQNQLIFEEEKREKDKMSKEKKLREQALKKQKKEAEKERRRKEKEREEADKKKIAEEKRLNEQREKERQRMEEERKRIELEMIELARKQLQEKEEQKQLELERQRQREKEQQEREEKRLREEKEEEERLEAQLREQKKQKKATKKEKEKKPAATKSKQNAQKKQDRQPSPSIDETMDEEVVTEEYVERNIMQETVIYEASPSQFVVEQDLGRYSIKDDTRSDRSQVIKSVTNILEEEEKVISAPQRRQSVTSTLMENSIRLNPHEQIGGSVNASNNVFNNQNSQQQIPQGPFSWGATTGLGSGFLSPQPNPMFGPNAPPQHQLFGTGFPPQPQTNSGSMFSFSGWGNDPFQQSQLMPNDNSFNRGWGVPQQVQHQPPQHIPPHHQPQAEYNVFYGYAPFHQHNTMGSVPPVNKTPIQRNPVPFPHPPQDQQPHFNNSHMGNYGSIPANNSNMSSNPPPDFLGPIGSSRTSRANNTWYHQ